MLKRKSLNFNELQKIITSSKHCIFKDNHCILRSKFARAILDFGEFDTQLVSISFKRFSGNGLLSVIGQEDLRVIDTVSLDINLSENKVIEIIRPKESVGDIVISNVEVFLSKEEENLDWKKIINQCSGHKGIKLANNKLYVVENAFIQDDVGFIKEIVTKPLGLCRKQDNKFKFFGHCEIVDIVLSGEGGAKPISNVDIFVSREEPFPKLGQKIGPNLENKEVKKKMEFNKEEAWVIYDSAVASGFSGFIANAKNLSNTIKSNKEEYLLIRSGGISQVALLTIKPGVEYNIVLNAKKLNGNGKLYVWLADSILPIKDRQLLAVGDSLSERIISVVADGNSEAYKLYLSMEGGTGEILLSRVRVFQNDRPEGGDYLNQASSSYNLGLYKKKKEEKIVTYSKESSILSGRKKFVIVIPSYNNEKWVTKNLTSAITQDYPDYRVIFTDDCSSDKTFEKAEQIASRSNCNIKLIKNENRLGALENLYNMITSCEDEEIILTLDGDDWLAHDGVLKKLNEIYTSYDVWITYGQYQNYPDGGRGIAKAPPGNVIKDSLFRQFDWCYSHLRTFYAWLFKQIKKEDLCYNGNFMSMTWDLAMMFPMVEMAGTRQTYIDDILYIYNLDNPINDHKVNVKLQQDLDRYVRRLPKYKTLDKPAIDYQSIGLLVIATGKYDQYIQGLISSADNYFLPGLDVKYYIFSDKDGLDIRSQREIKWLPIEHKPFPYASMMRFEHFMKYEDELRKNKYLYYVDVDSLFVDYIGTEIFGNLVGVAHCGYYNNKEPLDGPLERDPKSSLCIDKTKMKKYKFYAGGGFNGGLTTKYLEMAQWCRDRINEDLANNIIPIFHDESALNAYFIENEPVILTPSYHHPQKDINRYRKIWGCDFAPKILLLDKKHNEVRG